MKSHNSKLMAIIAVSVLFAGSGMLLVSNDIEDAQAAASDYGTPTVIEIAPGMKYTYKPTYNVTATTTIEEQGLGNSKDGNWGKVSSGTLNVNVPSSATPGTTYNIVLKGTSSNPTQTVYTSIALSIVANAAVSGSHQNIVTGSAVSMTPTVTGMGTYTWTVTAGKTLPAGLSLDPATGKVTGTPTQTGTCKIYLTATSTYHESQDLVVTFEVVPVLAVTNSPTAGAIAYVTG